MSDKSIPLEYANSLVYELEKAFWDERGEGARFRTTTIGQKYVRDKCLPKIQSDSIDGIIQVIHDTLKEEKIVGDISSETEERLLRIRIEGCIHREVEESLLEYEVPPFTCIPANLIALGIEEKLDLPVELAEIKLEDGACHLLIVVFEERHTLM